ncbi:MAG: TrkA family potassium uptake protein, partial [Candidatus Aminicenantes bacterium]|nr:TrkA family potassium uptake protein [Candidatus Aminicenantes bacterium]
RMTLIPPADFVIKDSDILIILGEEKALARINSH